MRIALATSATKILPSPTSPVRAASASAKPACMNSTSVPAINNQTMLIAAVASAIAPRHLVGFLRTCHASARHEGDEPSEVGSRGEAACWWFREFWQCTDPW